jgi:glyoxylate/hydroxypyruvate reductase
VERIRSEVPGVRVHSHPELLPPPRYVADHTGDPAFRRTASQEAAWHALLAEADVLYDFDRDLAPRLPELAPRLRWIQATSSGIGPFVQRAGLDRADLLITNAAGIHAIPLAEHTLLALLYFVKEVPRLRRDQAAQRWERSCGRELRGLRATIVGLGAVGREIARTLRAVGLHVTGVRRTPTPDAAAVDCDRVIPPSELHAALPATDALVLIAPHTPETEGMIDARALALLPRGAILVNVARGALIDEDALLAALRSGALEGAALDVARTEPLPAGHPLWDEPNVLLTAHSASTVERENERLTDLFIDNLHRFRAGAPLRNLLRL